MLTAEIKQKIDSARNILVGKIPTPTGQVEQITLALVYKFMNDIDEQNKELGGTLKFFVGDYQKYAWKHLLDKSLSAYERVTAYGEGLEKMHLNPNLPQFFRNVFKGAFLPFRDPEVLTLFLKQIDEFRYGVNGDLGDAFEYLLQVMGTQGDAGQFLTPRHIINFIVSVVDPQKTDKILDPAVGTAGFLISTYQHLLTKNTLEGSNKPGSALTIDDRKRFANNFVGYDVSHDLVRLSLVNLYLHNFADPKIYEYDTLGNVDRWDDDFDCILTNPPFMTPKGGVKPHKRFSIQAKRSEVLFVDYIIEHLNPNGKAGIIVPEGIIFQSATAYKALRKMMIDQNFLYAVVSLPAGIFQPYSGVKTSILLIDRVIAKKTKDILFVKVENDGFDLGAQRRSIDKNDLPTAAEILKRYKLSIQTGKPFLLSEDDRQIANLVPIEKIGKSGDYNLSGDRYKETIAPVNQKWPQVELGELADILKGSTITKNQTIEGTIPVIAGGQQPAYFHNEANRNGNVITVSASGAYAGFVNYFSTPIFASDCSTIQSKDQNKVITKYLFNLLKSKQKDIHALQQGGGQPHVYSKDLRKIQIPLPPLEVQQEIVSHLDSYQKIIDGAKLVVDNYKPEIKIDPDWDKVALGEVFRLTSGKFLPQKNQIPGDYLVYGGNGITGKHNEYFLEKETLIIGRVGEYCGAVHLTQPKSWVTDNALYVVDYLLEANQEYLAFALSDLNINNFAKRGGQPSISQSTIYDLSIPLPPLDIQKQIVSRIEEEQLLVDANKKLIEIYQGKIKEKIGEVWGE